MRTSFITDRGRIDEIIKACDVCFVGMNGEDGVPYVIPMNFGYEGDTLLLHSAREGRHVDLLARDNRVSVTFCPERTLRCQHPDVACSYSMESASVIAKGRVSFVDDDDLEAKRQVLTAFMRHYVPGKDFRFSEPALRNVRVWQVQIDTLTAKAFGQHFRNRQIPDNNFKKM